MKNTDTDINGTLRVQDDGLAPSIGAQAIHILARLLSESVIRRDGDQLEGRSYPPITLTPDEQYLIRHLEETP